jgi:hypothetical protein
MIFTNHVTHITELILLLTVIIVSQVAPASKNQAVKAYKERILNFGAAQV